MRHPIAIAALAVVNAATILTGVATAGTVGHPAPAARPVVSRPLTVEAAAVHVVRPQPAAARRPAVRPQHPHVVQPVSPQRLTPALQVAVRRTLAQPVQSAPQASPEAEMQQAVGRIPGYQPGQATWVMTTHFDHWGVADLDTGVIYVRPSVPADKMYDVVVHEWSHVLSVKDYNGDVSSAVDAMNHYFGGSGLAGAEIAADCMARQLGADWTHYTSCSNARWQAGARRLLAHEQL